VDDDTSEFQERERKKEKQRLESQLEEVKKILKGRDSVHEFLKDELEDEIRSQKGRLDNAQKDDVSRIRGILEDLYRERRQEVKDNWRDRQSLLERKMDLEKEIDEIESVLDLDLDG